MRQVALTSAKGGIQRLRSKGGAKPDTLWDGVNCYVTAALSIVPRPGTVIAHQLSPGTKGLCYFKDKLHVFSSDVVISNDPGVVVNVLRHPDQALSGLALKEIHFAEPFLGFLYVVAEFEPVVLGEEGDVFHYWLQETGSWEPNHVYLPGEVIQPTVPNGYAYEATRLNEPAPTWAPNVARAVGDIIEPTKVNGYQYEVIDTLGDSPRSGTTEPVWIASDGAIIYEDASNPTQNEPGTGDGNTPPTLPPSIPDRYGGKPGL